ncbi:MAG: hypothetical protein D6826_04165 [Alphaproteobacteria bacterium]|nr:MAG: hypothetical protein D6826_04165 [Alphaproteobacteria bacterium]
MDLSNYLRFVVALIFVLALIAALTWVVRRLGLGGALPATRGASARLSLVEIKVVDSRRKLVLLRCDEREHLVLLGPNQDLLIEHVPSAASPVIADGSRRSTETKNTTDDAKGTSAG